MDFGSEQCGVYVKRLSVVVAIASLVAAASFLGLSIGFSAPQVPIKPIPVPVSSASVSLALSATSPTATLGMSINGIVPGTSVEREVTIANTGTVSLTGIYLHTSVSGSSPLFAPGGLQLAIARCSGVPSISGTSFACPGAVTVASRPLGSYRTTTVASNVARGSSVYLLFTFSLPANASNSYAAKSAGVSWQFVGVS